MLVKTHLTTVTVLFFLLLCSVNLFANETTKKSGKTKILIGSGLMAGGAALVLTSDVNFFHKSDNLQILGGIGMFGAGAALTIWGLVQNSHKNLASTSMKEDVEPRMEMQFIAGPTRKGIASGLILKW